MANAPSSKRPSATKFNINYHSDILLEILTRLDDRSLGVAACVCHHWNSLTQNDAFWEMLCFRQSSSFSQRQVVSALGGYKKLYMVCVRRRRVGFGCDRAGWSREEMQMWLSLFCVDCYERFGDCLMMDAKTTPSLMFLCEPVNV